jgi:hypothetical protein
VCHVFRKKGRNDNKKNKNYNKKNKNDKKRIKMVTKKYGASNDYKKC